MICDSHFIFSFTEIVWINNLSYLKTVMYTKIEIGLTIGVKKWYKL